MIGCQSYREASPCRGFFIHDGDGEIAEYSTGGSGTTTTWAYDLINEVTGLSDNAGNTLATTFDHMGRALTASQTLPGLTGAKVVTYAYDNGAGDKVNRSRMTWPDGYYVNYAYDTLNHLTTETDSGGTVLASRTYDQLARPATTQYPHTVDNIAYAWDAQDNLTTLTDNFYVTAATVSFNNSFTPAKQWASSNITATAYKYAPSVSGTDAYATASGLNQYPSMTPAGQSPPPANGHDCSGNAQAISYDCGGNLTGDGTWTFAYDPENRLLTANKTAGSAVAASYVYDPLGRRIEKSGTGVTTTFFIHDGDSEIAEYDGSGAASARSRAGDRFAQPRPGKPDLGSKALHPGHDLPLAEVRDCSPLFGPNRFVGIFVDRCGCTCRSESILDV